MIEDEGLIKCFRNCNFDQRSAFIEIYFILYALFTFLLALSLSLCVSLINAIKSRKRAVGIFHPYTNDGGGGESTSGYAFTYPLARLFGCKVVCYTHYPTISLDMIYRVRQRNSMYNNDFSIAKSNLLSTCKLVYYRAFSWMYGMVDSCTHLAMVKSSWTKSHIEVLWRIPERIKRVYPLMNSLFLTGDVAHNSAGPKMDIVLEEDGQRTGYLAESVEEYAEAILEIVKMNETDRLKMAASARKRAARFS